jgi:transcriptional regulator with XRE-family HTH domain
VKDRIKQILLDEGLTSGAFADEIGVQRSSISHILNGRNNPSLDFVIKVVTRFRHINLAWLMLGKGEMLGSEIVISESTAKPNPTIFSELLEASSEADVLNVDELSENQVDKSINTSRQVSKIVIFYSDSSFSMYNPNK